MANILIYDEVTKQAKEYLISVNTPDYSSRSDVLVHPDMPNAPLKYIKVENGLAVEMTQAEKDAIDLAEQQAKDAAETARVANLDTEVTKLRTITVPKIDNAIDNIGSLQDAKVFLKKLCRYIVSMRNSQ